MPDIAKSHDAGMDNKEFGSLLEILMRRNSFLFQPTSCHFLVEVFPQMAQRLSRDLNKSPCNNCGVTEGNSQTVGHRYHWIILNP